MSGAIVAGCYFVAGTALAGRTAGQAVLGLRVVDEATGRSPGCLASMIRWVVLQSPRVLSTVVSRSSFIRRNVEQLRDVQPKVDELRRRHGTDQQSSRVH